MTAERENQAGEPISGNMAVCAFVSGSILFKKLSPEDIDAIYQKARLVCYAKNEVVIREGDSERDLYLLMKGNVKVETAIGDGEMVLAQLARGAFFGEVALLTGRPRTATVTAQDEVQAVVIDGEQLAEFLTRYPKMGKLMRTVMEGRVRSAIEKAQE